MDLCNSVGVCAKYQANPKESHILVVKKIIKYVSGTTELGLSYTHGTMMNLVGYCDVDWTGNNEDRKSTTGGCFSLGNNLVSWFNRKKNCISLSTIEAEYIVVGSGCTHLI